ncbi:hypothetical protein PR202_ga04095 [Eleusine coracana subsp. coracana]|uniref:Uncharacterized protein n=1 Tax=Eleusine coracana subsp. coracana TaxID=191504 RepID=A0AAV5BPF6_ELECO|nr:hypothetical protein PR202_ga04095 [Eleusine coracana subsp. coracana]
MSEEGDEENRLRSLLRHLQAEAGVLERLVYKHRNQHRGAAYFQFLVKMRRDLKLLLGAGLADVTNAVFPVLASRKPVNTILLAPTKSVDSCICSFRNFTCYHWVPSQSKALFAISVTTSIGDGNSTLFWTDRWIHGKVISELATALMPHVRRRGWRSLTVRDALQGN